MLLLFNGVVLASHYRARGRKAPAHGPSLSPFNCSIPTTRYDTGGAHRVFFPSFSRNCVCSLPPFPPSPPPFPSPSPAKTWRNPPRLCRHQRQMSQDYGMEYHEYTTFPLSRILHQSLRVIIFGGVYLATTARSPAKLIPRQRE